jgi:hypothetical protein
VDDYTRHLSTILAGLSIQAANGSTKAELKRTAEMALRYSGYWRVSQLTSDYVRYDALMRTYSAVKSQVQ